MEIKKDFIADLIDLTSQINNDTTIVHNRILLKQNSIEYRYFDQSNKAIKDLIKKQSDTVCQQKIGVDYIKDRLKDFDYGFIRKLSEAQIGRMQYKKKEIVNSFILCKIIPDPYVKEISITLVCSRINSKDGKQLMHLAEIKAKELKCQRLSLIAVGNTNLLNWYISQNFILLDDKPILNSKSKAYYMRKYIN